MAVSKEKDAFPEHVCMVWVASTPTWGTILSSSYPPRLGQGLLRRGGIGSFSARH